ncbi:hypothetical protein ACTHPH_23975 [Paenibacillus pasadenensis]|uniref:hypothetical protein n=1 Tax=Paenibacillus pasadenensis TaxID=217090 RepID=UPI0004193C1D|nr:hypothetical protein [Paenibacillus pasadenensis]
MAKPKITLTAEQIQAERSVGKTIKQIAEEHNVGESTVYNRLGPPGSKPEDAAAAKLAAAKRELEEARQRIAELEHQNASFVALAGEAAEKQQAEIERLKAEHEQHAQLRRNAYEAHNAAQERLQERVKHLEEQLNTAETEKAMLLQTIERAARPEPATEAQLLDRAIGEMTRVRKLIYLYAAGE